MVSLGFLRNDCSSKVHSEVSTSQIFLAMTLILVLIGAIGGVCYVCLKNRGSLLAKKKFVGPDGPKNVELPVNTEAA